MSRTIVCKLQKGFCGRLAMWTCPGDNDVAFVRCCATFARLFPVQRVFDVVYGW